MNYTTDIRGDLIIDGFDPTSGAPNSHDRDDLDLPADGVQENAPAAALVLDPEQIVPSEDRRMDPATEAMHLPEREPNTDPPSCEGGVIEPLDSSAATGIEPRASMPIETDWAPVMEFTAADIF